MGTWDGRGEWAGGGGVGGLQCAGEGDWWYMGGSGWWCEEGMGKDRGPVEGAEEGCGGEKCEPGLCG